MSCPQNPPIASADGTESPSPCTSINWRVAAPVLARAGLLKRVRAALGPDYDIATHFNPRYNPWEQRLCLAPDGDFFQAIKSGRASIVTGEVETFTARGIHLLSGQDLEADIVVTATGLVLQQFGGAELRVDGRLVEPANALSYKGVMLSGVPNFASVFGYVNASWTLKADLICAWVCRLLNFMDRKGVRQVTPASGDQPAVATFVEHFSSGYIQRSQAQWPRQGSRPPWRVHQNYIRDILSLRRPHVDNGALQFSNPTGRETTAPNRSGK